MVCSVEGLQSEECGVHSMGSQFPDLRQPMSISCVFPITLPVGLLGVSY